MHIVGMLQRLTLCSAGQGLAGLCLRDKFLHAGDQVLPCLQLHV